GGIHYSKKSSKIEQIVFRYLYNRYRLKNVFYECSYSTKYIFDEITKRSNYLNKNIKKIIRKNYNSLNFLFDNKKEIINGQIQIIPVDIEGALYLSISAIYDIIKKEPNFNIEVINKYKWLTENKFENREISPYLSSIVSDSVYFNKINNNYLSLIIDDLNHSNKFYSLINENNINKAYNWRELYITQNIIKNYNGDSKYFGAFGLAHISFEKEEVIGFQPLVQRLIKANISFNCSTLFESSKMQEVKMQEICLAPFSYPENNKLIDSLLKRTSRDEFMILSSDWGIFSSLFRHNFLFLTK
ncbi:MAG TPA: hypothetical protein PK637_13420, partial [Flavobacteriales bacterium]|nr:hypothetical protein [Flavobacteriales bacterium]